MKKLFFLSFLLMSFVAMAQETSYTCEGTDITLTCTATGGTAPTISWESPSGSTVNNASVTTSEAGTWTWTIEEGGCSVSGTHILIVEADPTASITINAVDNCVNTTQTISATGVPSGYSYSWNFGTGSTPGTSTNASEDVSYSSAGTKTITLTIEKSFTGSTNGCSPTCSWVITKNITITELSGSSSCAP